MLSIAFLSHNRSSLLGAVETFNIFFVPKLQYFQSRTILHNSIADVLLLGPQRLVYPREVLGTMVLPEASTRGLGDMITGWGTIWSMAFVTMADDQNTSSDKGESLLLLAVLVHRQVTFLY